MEYFDVLDENGVKTGGVLSRDDVHKQGLWHRSVIGVVVNEENKILMQQRSLTKKKYPGLWDLSVAGHIRSGEDPVTAINRELNEEIGYLLSRNVKLRDCRFLTSFKNQHSYEEFGQTIYERGFYELFIIQCEGQMLNLAFNDSEVQNMKWLSYFEVKKMQEEGKLHPRTEWIEEVFSFLNRI